MITVLNHDAVQQLTLQGFEFIHNKSSTDRVADTYLCHFESNHKLTGMLKLNIKDQIVWFSFIEVLPEYRGKGIARSLMKYLFIYCRSNRLGTISFSHFTAMGLTFIKPIVKELSTKYPYIHVIMDK